MEIFSKTWPQIGQEPRFLLRLVKTCYRGTSPYLKVPAQVGAESGQGASVVGAEHVIVDAPLSLNPLLQLNVATLPCALPLLFCTLPLAGGLTLVPVHCGLVSATQLPFGVAPSQVMSPRNPSLHAHAVPAFLFELATLHGAAEGTRQHE